MNLYGEVSCINEIKNEFKKYISIVISSMLDIKDGLPDISVF